VTLGALPRRYAGRERQRCRHVWAVSDGGVCPLDVGASGTAGTIDTDGVCLRRSNRGDRKRTMIEIEEPAQKSSLTSLKPTILVKVR
jgi:hypothetical protein